MHFLDYVHHPASQMDDTGAAPAPPHEGSADLGHSQAETAATRERGLRIAARRVRAEGVNRLGVAELMKAAGLTYSGFYKHFASRDDLIARAAAVAPAEGTAKKERAANKPAGKVGTTRRASTAGPRPAAEPARTSTPAGQAGHRRDRRHAGCAARPHPPAAPTGPSLIPRAEQAWNVGSNRRPGSRAPWDRRAPHSRPWRRAVANPAVPSADDRSAGKSGLTGIRKGSKTLFRLSTT